jgi:hypothetical protein
MKKSTIIIIAVILLGLLVSTYTDQLRPNKTTKPTNTTQTTPKEDKPIEDTSDPDIETKLTLKVPFTSQAPHANWDDPYQEACEEASLIMAYDYTQGVKSYTKKQADKKILDLIQYEEEIGYTQDINIQELQTIAKDYYQVDSLILEGDSINSHTFIKFLSQGAPIIIPASGKSLNNPNFSGEGPAYHMLVIIGYNQNTQTFITHDPGTRNGANYEYSFQTILNSIHDWTGSKETVTQGAKKALILQT